MGSRSSRFALFLAFLLSAGSAEAACAPDSVEVKTRGGAVAYQVEIADTQAERARGLMFREEMAPDEGMFFIFQDVRERAFWMRNTPLPLDIIYINKRGVICSIAENTTPFSDAPIPSGCAAAYVLEVNAGQSAARGLKVGAPVRHPAMNKPVWACE
ncbi:MAG: DUF192 domain-containing protein [Pseudomonadota bacterium]